MQKILKITEQTSWQILGKVITSLSTLTILSLVARQYGATDLGILTLSLTFIAFFTLAVDFGVNAYILPVLTSDKVTEVFAKLLGFRLVLSVILMVVGLLVLLLWPGLNPVFRQLSLFGLAMAILQQLIFTSANAVFQSKLRYDLSVISTITGSLVILLGVILVTYLRLPLYWIMVAYLYGWFTMFLLSLNLVTLLVQPLKLLLDWKFIKQVLSEAWPISLTLVLNVVYFRVDAFILSGLKSFQDVGIYNLAYQIFQAALVLPTFIMNAYYPLMLKSFAENKREFLRDLRIGVLAMLIIGLMGVAATLILSPLVIGLVAGSKGFEGSVAALNILSLGFPAFFVSSLLMWTLVTLKRFKIMTGIYLVGLIFNGLANWLLIPRYSFLASAWVTGVSEYLILLLQLLVLWKYLKRE